MLSRAGAFELVTGALAAFGKGRRVLVYQRGPVAQPFAKWYDGSKWVRMPRTGWRCWAWTSTHTR